MATDPTNSAAGAAASMTDSMGAIYDALLPSYKSAYDNMMTQIGSLDMMNPQSIIELQVSSSLVTKPLDIASNLISKMGETSSRIINNYN